MVMRRDAPPAAQQITSAGRGGSDERPAGHGIEMMVHELHHSGAVAFDKRGDDSAVLIDSAFG